jgi:simple sugar transport system permease protein
LAIIVALVLFSLLFVLGGVNPFEAYQEIFSYAFGSRFGVPLTINRFIFLLLSTYAFTIPYRAGLWNIGMAGQFYAGAISVYTVLLAFGVKGALSGEFPSGILIPLMLIAASIGGALLAGIAGFLKGKYNINEIVVTMMLNFIMFWMVSFMIKEGGPFMNPGGRGESFELPASLYAPLIQDVRQNQNRVPDKSVWGKPSRGRIRRHQPVQDPPSSVCYGRHPGRAGGLSLFRRVPRGI